MYFIDISTRSKLFLVLITETVPEFTFYVILRQVPVSARYSRKTFFYRQNLLIVFINFKGITWMLFSHISDAQEMGMTEEALIISEAEKLGAEVMLKESYTGSSIYKVQFPK